MADLPRLVDRLSALTVIEAADLAKMLEEKWGVSASAPEMVHIGPAPTEPFVEQQTEFTVKLISFGEGKKVPVLKEARQITGLGLTDVQKLINALPANLKENVSAEEAAKIKGQIEAAGGSVEIF